jgi:putative spermidine/putrescine transport system ATP-binding protein
MTNALQLNGIWKSFGPLTVLKDITFELKKGEFVTMLGPSGSGKSTTLQIIAGFFHPDQGNVQLHGRDISAVNPNRRNIGMVFQDYALFPHMTILDNVAFPLEARSIGKKQRHDKAAELLNIVGLGSFMERFPRQLSGGQRQRVALARALVFNPDIVLLDEPLGALDKKLRTSMQIEILRITREFGATVISVTHDQEEALIMSDRIALFKQGELAQVGKPRELYAEPNSIFTADFLGESNMLSVELESHGDTWILKGDNWRYAIGRDRVSQNAERGRATLMLRPEHMAVYGVDEAPGLSETHAFATATVRDAVYLGFGIRVFALARDGTELQIITSDQFETNVLAQGREILLGWKKTDGVVLCN